MTEYEQFSISYVAPSLAANLKAITEGPKVRVFPGRRRQKDSTGGFDAHTTELDGIKENLKEVISSLGKEEGSLFGEKIED